MEEENQSEEIKGFGIADTPVRVIKKFNSLRAISACKTNPEFLDELLRFYELNHRDLQGKPAQTKSGERIFNVSKFCAQDIQMAQAQLKSCKDKEGKILGKFEREKFQGVVKHLTDEYLKQGSKHSEDEREAIRQLLAENAVVGE